jgi:hypothetical protein
VTTEIEMSTFSVTFSGRLDKDIPVSMVPLPEDRTMLFASLNPYNYQISYFSYTFVLESLNF